LISGGRLSSRSPPGPARKGRAVSGLPRPHRSVGIGHVAQAPRAPARAPPPLANYGRPRSADGARLGGSAVTIIDAVGNVAGKPQGARHRGTVLAGGAKRQAEQPRHNGRLSSMPTNINLRVNAFKLGVYLLWQAANPWSGLPLRSAPRFPPRPQRSYEFPEWLPLEALRGRELSLHDLAMIKRASLASHCPESPERQHSAAAPIAANKHPDEQN
jgi:hypothetical protein